MVHIHDAALLALWPLLVKRVLQVADEDRHEQEAERYEHQDEEPAGGHGSGRLGIADERPIDLVVELFARDACRRRNIGSPFGGHAACVQPVLDVLPKHPTTDSCGELGGAVLEHVEGSLDSGFLSHGLRLVQVCLHSNTQTHLRTSRAKSFAMKSIGEQAREFRLSKGWNYTEMASEVSKYHRSAVSRQLITQLEDKGDRRPQYLTALAKAMGTTSEVLEAGLYVVPAPWDEAKTAAPIASKSATTSTDDIHRVPIVGTAQLGDNGNFYALDYPVGHGDGYLQWPSKDLNAYGLRCKGESMKPRIRHGEYVVVEPNHVVTPGDEVLVRSKDGRVMVKQLAYVRDGLVHLDSVNESHPRISLAAEDVALMHYVAGIAKGALWSEDSHQAPSAPKAKSYPAKNLPTHHPATPEKSKSRKAE